MAFVFCFCLLAEAFFFYIVESKTKELEELITLYFSLINCEYIYTKVYLTFLIDYNSIRQVS